MTMRQHLKVVHWMYGILYLVAASMFGYIFVAKHLPIVGLEHVLDNWVLYILFWAGGTSMFLLFYFFSIFMVLVLSVGEE